MKLGLWVFACLFGSLAFATTGIRNFEVKDAKFDPLHNLSQDSAAELIVNYDEELVTLIVQKPAPPCRQGFVCVQMMPIPFISELPIVNVETSACGVRIVTAMRDDRPQDGSFEKIKLTDASDLNCETFREVSQKATYLTRYFSYTMGQEVATKSTMNLVVSSRQESNEKVFSLVHGQYLQGFLSHEEPVSGELRISGSQAFLNVFSKLNCDKPGACPRVMTRPIRAQLNIIQDEKTGCGDRITAVAKEQRAEGIREQTVEIMDYSHAACDIAVHPGMTVDFKETIRSESGRSQTRKAILTFDGDLR